MYYLYGLEKNIYIKTEEDEDFDSTEEYTLILEKIPEPLEPQDGKSIVLFIDPDTLEVSWIYEDSINL